MKIMSFKFLESSDIILIVLLISVWAIIIWSLIYTNRNKADIDSCKQELELLKKDIVTDSNTDLKITEWHLFINALMKVESNNNEYAVGTKNDVGVLQITPIYVEEVNRLLGHKKYTLKDRLDKYKSIEMFEVINRHYNPEKSFKQALKIHNPGAGQEYREKVLNELLTEMQKNHE